MKPFGREKKLQGSGSWKKDYHPRPKKKWQNWWEDICDHLSRGRMKQIEKKQIEKDLND
jgi:hypothetical protein